MARDLSQHEIELLINGLTDDVAFVWVLIHVGIRANPPTDPRPPSDSDVHTAFSTLDRLSLAGLVKAPHGMPRRWASGPGGSRDARGRAHRSGEAQGPDGTRL